MQSERERHLATNSLKVKTSMSCKNRVKSNSVVAMGKNHRTAASSTTGTNNYFSQGTNSGLGVSNGGKLGSSSTNLHMK